MKNVLYNFYSKFNLGTVPHGPGRMRLYGFNIVEAEYFSFRIEADDKIQELELNQLTILRNKEVYH